jgi:hypothetical protein
MAFRDAQRFVLHRTGIGVDEYGHGTLLHSGWMRCVCAFDLPLCCRTRSARCVMTRRIPLYKRFALRMRARSRGAAGAAGQAIRLLN